MQEVDRRKLLKTAAWSAPVIAVAAAAPLAAASGGIRILSATIISPSTVQVLFTLDPAFSGPTPPSPTDVVTVMYGAPATFVTAELIPDSGQEEWTFEGESDSYFAPGDPVSITVSFPGYTSVTETVTIIG